MIGVGGTTEGGCLGDYSLRRHGRSTSSPPAAAAAGRLRLGRGAADLPGHPQGAASTTRFADARRYVGTSMAAAHVSGVAAMVLASGVLDPDR